MALALDSSTPAQVDKTTAGSTATTGSFTAPTNALLVAWFESDEGGQINSTIADTGGLTWTRLARICANTVGEANTPTPTGTVQDGYVSVWSATTASSTSRTVTVTVTGAGGTTREAMFSVMVYTDTGGAPGTGAVASKGGSASAPSHAVTTTATNSWVWAGISDWSAAGAGTAGSNQTLQHDHAGTNVSAHLVKQNATTPGSGSSVTMNATAPASQTWNEVVVEVLANTAAGGGGGTQPPAQPGRTWLRRFRHRQVLPSVPGSVAPPVTTQDLPPQVPARDRVSWLARGKARRAEPPPAPIVAVTTQALPAQPPRSRMFPFPRRRPTSTQVIVTVRQLPVQPPRDRLFPMPRRRGVTTQPVPAPVVTVTTQDLPPQPRRRLTIPVSRRRGRASQPVPAQVVIVTGPQALPPQPGRRRWGFLPRARARQAQPVPAQVVIVTGPQALPPQPGRRRFAILPRPRPRQAQPLPPQVVLTVQPLPPQPATRRKAPVSRRRGRSVGPVPPAVTTQKLPPQPGRRRFRLPHWPKPAGWVAWVPLLGHVILPEDGTPVDNPGLVLTSPVPGLILTSPVPGLALAQTISETTLTVPAARLEITVATFTTSDTAPDLTGTCTSNGVPANITGATLALHWKKPSGTIVTKPGVIDSGPAGTWHYTWQTGDLDETGTWWVETQVTYSGGKIQTFGPSAFAVVEQLG